LGAFSVNRARVLQKERGLLRPGNKTPIMRDNLLRDFEARKQKSVQSAPKTLPNPKPRVIIDTADPTDGERPHTELDTPG
jgi:hypothetical protein